jgi:hypothetical protein
VRKHFWLWVIVAGVAGAWAADRYRQKGATGFVPQWIFGPLTSAATQASASAVAPDVTADLDAVDVDPQG